MQATISFWPFWPFSLLNQSTYCSSLYQHCETVRRTVHIVNLDPAAESFDYPVAMGIYYLNILSFLSLLNCKFHSVVWITLYIRLSYYLPADIRELISLDDVMEELGLGPNGGLIYCMEYPLRVLVPSFVYILLLDE